MNWEGVRGAEGGRLLDSRRGDFYRLERSKAKENLWSA